MFQHFSVYDLSTRVKLLLYWEIFYYTHERSRLDLSMVLIVKSILYHSNEQLSCM
jgi:hypothetical protein